MTRALIVLLVLARSATAAPIKVLENSACDAAGLVQRVEVLVGHDISDGPDVLTVEMGRDRDDFVGHLVAVGHSQPERVVRAGSCDELLDQLALVVAIALSSNATPQPQTTLPIITTEPPPTAPAPNPSSSSPVSSVSRAQPSETGPQADSVTTISLRADARARATSVDFLAGGAFSATPDHYVGALVIGARLRRDNLSLGLELSIQTPTAVQVEPMEGINVWLSSLTAVPCIGLHLANLSACGLASVGLAEASPHALASERTVLTPTGALGARLAWEHELTSHTGVRVHADVLATYASAQFDINGMDVWSTPGVAAWLGIDVLARFP